MERGKVKGAIVAVMEMVDGGNDGVDDGSGGKEAELWD